MDFEWALERALIPQAQAATIEFRVEFEAEPLVRSKVEGMFKA
jgi:hypothetical protein